MPRIRLAAILSLALFLSAAPALAQTQSSTALDTLCPTSFDYTCKAGQTDKQGKPCGQGLPVASTQVKGICVAGDKAEETSFLNQDGQWTSSSQDTSQQTAAQSGAGASSGAAQVTPASAVTLQPTQPSAAQALEPQTAAQAQNSIVPGTSVLENAAQDAFKWLIGEGSAAPTDVSNIAPGDSTDENTIFNPQPMVPTEQVQSLTSEAPTTPTTEAGANPDYEPAASTFSQTVAQPMGSLQDLTPEQVQSGNSYAQDTLADQSNGQTALQNANDVTGTIYYPGCVGGPAGCDVSMEGGLYGSKGNLLDPNVPTIAAGYQSGYTYGQVLNIMNPNTGLSVNAVVGDVCPGCGSGIDLTPAAANAIGLTQEQGVGTLSVGVVANTPNYSDGSQMTVALNANPNALNPWNAPPAVSLVSYSQPDFASLSTPSTWTQVSPELPPEPLPSYPVASVETGQELLEPAQPNPVGIVTQGPQLLQPYPVAPVQVGPALEQPYPTTQVEQGPSLAEPNPVVAVDTGLPLEPAVDWNAISQGYEGNVAESATQNLDQASLNDRLDQADQQTAAYQSDQQAIQAGEDAQLASREQQADEETTAYQNALQNAGSQVPLPEQAQITPADIASEVAQTNPVVSDEGLAFSPPGYQYDWTNPSENEALAYGSVQDNGENPLAVAEQNVPPTLETQTTQTSDLNNANPFDSGNQYAVTATCQGGGGVCGGDSASAAPGGTPLNGETDAVAVPKDNPYGIKIGDTVSVQIGGNVVQNVPVTDYTGSGSSNYVVSGALEDQLGGTGKDAALITPTQPSQPLPGSTLIGQGGIGSDFVSGQQQTAVANVEPQPQVTPQVVAPTTASVTEDEGLAFEPPGYEYSSWAQPSENEALAYGGSTANSEDEALAYGGTTPSSQPTTDQAQDNTTAPTAEQEAENSGNPYDCSGPCAQLQAQQQQANQQAAANALVNNSAVAKSGLNALASAGAGGVDTASIYAGMAAVRKMSSEASTLGDTQLVSQINQFLGVQNKMVSAYNQYNSGNWGAVGTLMTLQGQAVSLGGKILNTVNSKYGN